MLDSAAIKNLFIGKKLQGYIQNGDIEYHRKATILIILTYIILFLQLSFTCIKSFQGHFPETVINIVVFSLVFLAFLVMRRNGNLTVAAHIIVGLVCVQFIGEFSIDINHTFWSFAMPVAYFFILGARNGLFYAVTYGVLVLLSMFFTEAQHYSFDFKIRFMAVFSCISFFSYFFERIRQQTQEMLQKSQLHSRIQRDIALALGSEDEFTRSLNKALEIVIQTEAVDCGGVYFADHTSGFLTLAAHHGCSPEFAQSVALFPPDSPFTQLAMKGNPVYDFTITPANQPSSGDAEKVNYFKSIAVLPVKNEGKVIAVLNLASHTRHEIPADIKILFESIALNIGTAISRLIAIRDLRELSSRNDAILAAVPDIIMQVDANRTYTWANKAGYTFFGTNVIGKKADQFLIEEQDAFKKVDPLINRNDGVIYVESWQRRQDGQKRLLAWWQRIIKNKEGNVSGVLSSARDITDINVLEEQFRQTQKMDAIGQLAGGVAHDFNNQLTIITGFAELIRKKVAKDESLTHFADNILLTAQRSADLSSQLLAFSRKGKFLSVPINVHKIINEVVNILQHTIDKKITIRQTLNATPDTITGDPNQVQNALLNVALNARDAMPEGGELIFMTELILLDRNTTSAKTLHISAGPYLVVSIADTGMGMNADVKSHLFEPFFTTKAKDKGTGMGLPAVYGMIKNHRGTINVYSEPGMGTTIKLYLPASSSRSDNETTDTLQTLATMDKLRILFVEDEAMMREMASEMLQSMGHSAVLCENGKVATDYYRNSGQSIDLVILDMIMPIMGGKATFAALQQINPQVKVILSSGYSINDEAQQVISQGALAFVQKPFTSIQLADAIKKAMEKKQ